MAQALTVSPGEMMEARRWAAALFEGIDLAATPPPGLEVLNSYKTVERNGRLGKPLVLANRTYTRGLFCYANSRIVVRLPAPGQTFEAILGVDSNELTSGGGGRGTLAFVVQVGGKEVFRSGVCRETSPPLPVRIELGGAREFVLEVVCTGNPWGPDLDCDQADWADAKVTLAGGRALWLADLPMSGPPPAVADPARLPFSFLYDGRPSAELLTSWSVRREATPLDSQRTQRILTFTDASTGLVVRAVGVEYHDFPTLEWTLYFSNPGTTPTPILESIQALDLYCTRRDYGEYVLHHATGSPNTQTDYGPLETVLTPGTEKQAGGFGGRSTDRDWSYFNLEAPSEHGLIVAVGWPGQWSSRWIRDGGTALHVQAGQELTHFRLLPGEQVRSPLVVLQFYAGDWVRAQNIWRRWMLAHNVPRPGGKLPQPELFGTSGGFYNEMTYANEDNQKLCIDRYVEERLPIGHWWMDAGWYAFPDNNCIATDRWEVDRARFPNGLRAISDYAHARNIRTIVWFEPERVRHSTWLANTHPDWILWGAVPGQGLLNLGNPDARQWLTDHVDSLMTAEGIDLYRQDLNMEPLSCWRSADAPDRQGIAEIRHVEGLLAYWDELRRRHPNLLIDACASGGRRNDLEVMRRAVPLWRTDYMTREPVGSQCCTYGISFWLPLSGCGVADIDTYMFRSNIAPFMNCAVDIRRKDLDYARLRRLVAQSRVVADCMMGDFYPLTAYDSRADTWMAWQFDCPEANQGVVQAFRRDRCIFESGELRLSALDPEATYEVVDLDGGRARRAGGDELMGKGVLVRIKDRPGAAILTYRRVK
jgi:alpha-galactosidase